MATINKRKLVISDTDGTLVNSGMARILSFINAAQYVLSHEDLSSQERVKVRNLMGRLKDIKNCPVKDTADLIRNEQQSGYVGGDFFAKILQKVGLSCISDNDIRKQILDYEKNGTKLPNDFLNGQDVTVKLAYHLARIFRDNFTQGKSPVAFYNQNFWIVAQHILQSGNSSTNDDPIVIPWSSNDIINKLFHKSLEQLVQMDQSQYNQIKIPNNDKELVFLNHVLHQKDIQSYLGKNKSPISTLTKSFDLFDLNSTYPYNSTNESPESVLDDTVNTIKSKINSWNLYTDQTQNDRAKGQITQYINKLVDKQVSKTSNNNDITQAQVEKIIEKLLKKSPLHALAEIHNALETNKISLADLSLEVIGDIPKYELPVTKELTRILDIQAIHICFYSDDATKQTKGKYADNSGNNVTIIEVDCNNEQIGSCLISNKRTELEEKYKLAQQSKDFVMNV